jgi:prepilin signal peptidase PulO-like enzyme (type II secretory pathway)
MIYGFMIFFIGLFLGSFLGVVIDRLPYNKTIIKGRSYCDECKHALGVLDLIPFLSFVFLKGRCRYCKAKLSLFFPVVELITATLFAAIFFAVTTPLTVFNFKFILYLVYLLAIFSSFIAIFFIDLRNGIIPDKILVFDIALTLIWLLFNPLPIIINHLLSGIGSFIFFVATAYIFYAVFKKEGMGGGDVKLSFVLGFFLGFPAIVISLYLSFVIGALVGVIFILLKRKNIYGALPFGPFLIIGTLLTFFFQSQLQSIFQRVFGL